MDYKHESIMVAEVLSALNLNPSGIYIDGTLGGAGHSSKIAQNLTDGKLIGIDRDIESINHARRRLEIFENRFQAVHSNYVDIPDTLKTLGIHEVSGILMDLGVSSYQLDNPDRGFSYMHDAPLDMRMNQSDYKTASQIVNDYDLGDLVRVIRDYGEEKWAKKIATKIVNSRPIYTTTELAEIIKSSIPAAARRTGPHPAKRTFQAIRIEVNKELEALEIALQNAVSCLASGGRIVVISFHSLEDRIVKQTFKELAKNCDCPPESYKCNCNRLAKVKIINKKPILPTDEEIKYNPRARSAKLRIAERL